MVTLGELNTYANLILLELLNRSGNFDHAIKYEDNEEHFKIDLTIEPGRNSKISQNNPLAYNYFNLYWTMFCSRCE